MELVCGSVTKRITLFLPNTDALKEPVTVIPLHPPGKALILGPFRAAAESRIVSDGVESQLKEPRNMHKHLYK